MPLLRSLLVAPLVGVVFMVAVLLVLAASALDWRVVGADGAGRAAAGASVDGPLVVEIRPEELRLSGAAVSLDALGALVGERVARRSDRPVLVRVAHGVAFEESMKVLDCLAHAGVTRMSLIHPDIPHP